ncbi:MAG: phosphoribosylglycinamide formyltransferase [Candidatus Obscuribacterales bacterium]|nr:phosphoribosylglycinamide formyltransferase [Candidatus Obscuribacterales bacterium]
MSLKLVIMVSGRGSNMKAILEAIEQKELDAQVSLVFSNNAQAPALETAAKYGVQTASISSRGLSRSEHESLVVDLLKKHQFDYIVLAGYMRILSKSFLDHYRDKNGFYRVINIHPSLLPSFPGATGYDDAFNAGVAESGVTVHLVDEEVDHGPILAQWSFMRQAGDSLESFKARGLAIEHILYPRVLQSVARGGIALKDNKIGLVFAVENKEISAR